MFIDVLEIIQNNSKYCDIEGCVGCSHLKDVTVTSSKEVYVECDLDEEY